MEHQRRARCDSPPSSNRVGGLRVWREEDCVYDLIDDTTSPPTSRIGFTPPPHPRSHCGQSAQRCAHTDPPPRSTGRLAATAALTATRTASPHTPPPLQSPCQDHTTRLLASPPGAHVARVPAHLPGGQGRCGEHCPIRCNPPGQPDRLSAHLRRLSAPDAALPPCRHFAAPTTRRHPPPGR